MKDDVFDDNGDEPELVEAVKGISDELRTTRTQGQPVGLLRSQRGATPEILLWNIIKRSSENMSFRNYKAFMDYILCWDQDELLKLDPDEQALITGPKRDEFRRLRGRPSANPPVPGLRYLPFNDTDSYTLLNATLGVKFASGKASFSLRGTNLLNQEVLQHIYGDLIFVNSPSKSVLVLRVADLSKVRELALQ